jgi:hypothetical protein
MTPTITGSTQQIGSTYTASVSSIVGLPNLAVPTVFGSSLLNAALNLMRALVMMGFDPVTTISFPGLPTLTNLYQAV